MKKKIERPRKAMNMMMKQVIALQYVAVSIYRFTKRRFINRFLTFSDMFYYSIAYRFPIILYLLLFFKENSSEVSAHFIDKRSIVWNMMKIMLFCEWFKVKDCINVENISIFYAIGIFIIFLN